MSEELGLGLISRSGRDVQIGFLSGRSGFSRSLCLLYYIYGFLGWGWLLRGMLGWPLDWLLDRSLDGFWRLAFSAKEAFHMHNLGFYWGEAKLVSLLVHSLIQLLRSLGETSRDLGVAVGVLEKDPGLLLLVQVAEKVIFPSPRWLHILECLASNSLCQLKVLLHDCDSARMDCAQIRVLKHTNEKGFGGFLQGVESVRAHSDFISHGLSDFLD